MGFLRKIYTYPASGFFLFFVFCFLLYQKILSFELTYLDDNVWILDYQWYLSNINNLPQFFIQPDLISSVFYRPLLSLSFMANV